MGQAIAPPWATGLMVDAVRILVFGCRRSVVDAAIDHVAGWRMPDRRSQKVDGFVEGLVHGRKAEVVLLRDAILGARIELSEHVKWNAPSFCHMGDDRVTFRLQPGDRVELIFHRGAKKRDDVALFAFSDPTGRMKWATKDRGVISFADLADTVDMADQIVDLVESWMTATEE